MDGSLAPLKMPHQAAEISIIESSFGTACDAESGAFLRWDISKVPAQDEERWGDDEYDDDEDDGVSDEDGDKDDDDDDGEIYKGDMDWRDDGGDPTEVTKGAMPDDVFYLQVRALGRKCK